jgi:ribosomal peptide maturation radical SAM protein 1
VGTPKRLALAPEPVKALRAVVPRRVALVCMPFQAVEMPSIALGTLASLLRKEWHHVDVMHFNLDFAARIGFVPYEEIVSYSAWLRLYGEWLFADHHVAPNSASESAYREYLRGHRWRARAGAVEELDLSRLKAEADLAVERYFRARDWGSYDVVGFSVMFQQLNASLRLGRLIKKRHPNVRVVFGGSAMEVPMGQPVLDRHGWLDAVFSGYAERTFTEYVSELPRRGPRVITQSEPTPMDELPVPSFDEFFSAVREAGLDGAANYYVPIETSRGCWWGERQHCIFCGLNARDMKQRNKSADRVFSEVVVQSRHGRPFFATDNILPLDFFKGLFDRLITAGVPFDTFYETKANLNLKQLKTLRRAGINCIQPGIESLSTPILSYMKKGVSAAQNLWILRAAEEQGLGVAWSILYGFPKEDPAEYERIARMLPALSHLPPPLRPAPILLERYSPLFDRASEYGLVDVRPTSAHRAVFGDAPEMSDRAYTFDFEYGDGRDPDGYTTEMNHEVARWIDARRRLFSPRCEVFRLGDVRVVFDTRSVSRVGRAFPRFYVLTDAEWELVQLTEELQTPQKLAAAWKRTEPLQPILDEFVRRRWILRVDERWVRILMHRSAPFLGAELGRALRSGLQRARRLVARLRAEAGTRSGAVHPATA